MKKALLLLAATGMIAAGAHAQTQRTVRTNSRAHSSNRATITTIKEDQDPNTKNPDGTLDLSRNPGNGATGVDGTLNDNAHSGQNNSGAIMDQRSNNTTDESRPVQTTTTPATR